MDTDAASVAEAADSCNSDVAVEQEAIVTRFATLMGTKTGRDGQAAPPTEEEQKELLACFADAVSDDSVVCTMPSPNLKVSGQGDNPLPEVGQHMETDANPGAGLHPIMEASVLSTGEESLDPPKKDKKTGRTLSDTSSWTKSNVVYASASLLKDISDSFSSLVNSRVKSWTLLMFKNSISSGDNSNRSRILKMLAASINVSATRSNFRTLQLPANAQGQSKEADVILPLLFEVSLRVAMRDKSELVTLRAPGTVSGNFHSGHPKGLAKVDVRLDSNALLKSMGDQARLAVFKTVAGLSSSDMKASAPPKPAQADLKAPITGLSGFSSSLRLSSAQATNSPQLAKARSSALRLNSVLQGTSAGKNDQPAGIRKQRSVQWDHPMELPSIKGSTPPSSKKPRVAQTSTRLKSFKSFGRPHADDTSAGPRNATFANYGSKHIWGRDGKLANHPMPVNGIERPREDMDMGMKITGSVNATFGTPSSSAASRLAAVNAANRNAGVSRLPSSLPRTATALESWLLNAGN